MNGRVAETKVEVISFPSYTYWMLFSVGDVKFLLLVKDMASRGAAVAWYFSIAAS